jgi:hypothetical protein
MIMIIKAKYFFGFLHVVSRGNDSVVVISPDVYQVNLKDKGK